jgi:hypothetical protein
MARQEISQALPRAFFLLAIRSDPRINGNTANAAVVPGRVSVKTAVIW